MTPDSAAEDASRRISLVDAVCCIYFCAAGKSGLLIAVLASLGLEILIPSEVEEEVVRKRGQGQLASHWPRLRASDHVRILPPLCLGDSHAPIIEAVARVRRTSVRLALSARKDLGEAIVIGHARSLVDAGHEVYVLLDDQGAQVLASDEGLDILTVEDLLLAAVQLGLLARGKLRTTYNALRPFGSGLPSWPASSLKRAYEQWLRSS